MATATELVAIVLWIATSNLFNRINVTTRQQAPTLGGAVLQLALGLQVELLERGQGFRLG